MSEMPLELRLYFCELEIELLRLHLGLTEKRDNNYIQDSKTGRFEGSRPSGKGSGGTAGVSGSSEESESEASKSDNETLENSEESSTIKHESNVTKSVITYEETPTGKTIATRYIEGSFEVRLPDGSTSKLTNPTFSKYEVFAGKGVKKELNVRYHMVEHYGGKPDNWFHAKGYMQLKDADGNLRTANIHWFEEATVGIHEAKVKGWSKK